MSCVCAANVVIVVVILPPLSPLTSWSWLRLSSSTPHNTSDVLYFVCVCVFFVWLANDDCQKRQQQQQQQQITNSNILHFNALNSISQLFIILIFGFFSLFCASCLFCYVDRIRGWWNSFISCACRCCYCCDCSVMCRNCANNLLWCHTIFY